MELQGYMLVEDPNIQEVLVGHSIQKCYLKYGDLVKFSYNAPEKETG